MNFRKNESIKIFLIILLFYIISRLGIYTVCYFGNNLFSRYNLPSNYIISEDRDTLRYRMQLPVSVEHTYLPRSGDFIKFDSGYYIKIAEKGYDRYRMSDPHPTADWPFFPLYPILMRLISFVFPFISTAWSGFLLSNLFALFSLYFIYCIAMILTGERAVSEKAVIYLLLYPASIFLTIIYTESLFLFLSSLSIYLLLKKKLGWSILVASLSTVTRIPGFTNLMLIVLYLLKNAGYNLFRIKLKYYAGLLLSCIPLLSFFTYMYYLTGDFFAVFNELSLNWGRSTSAPFEGYKSYFSYPYFVTPEGWDLSLVSFLFTTAILIFYIVYMLIYRKNLEFVIYGIALILIPLSSSSFAFTSVVRYYMVSFPLFIFMAFTGVKNRFLDLAFTIFLFSFNVIYTIAFINNYFFVV